MARGDAIFVGFLVACITKGRRLPELAAIALVIFEAIARKAKFKDANRAPGM